MSAEFTTIILAKTIAVSIVANAKKLFGAVSREMAWEDAIAGVLEQAFSASDHLKGLLSSSYQERLEKFWFSPIAQTVIRKMWACFANVGRPESFQESDIEHSFLAAFENFLEPEGKDKEDIQEVGRLLFRSLKEACQVSMNSESGLKLRETIVGEQAHANLVIIDELAAIHRTMNEFLRLTEQASTEQVEEFAMEYARLNAKKNEYARHPDFDASMRIKIDDIFVAPTLLVNAIKSGVEPEKVNFSDLSGRLDRTVVLGNPGAGKSTAVQKICFDLSSEFIEHTESAKQKLLPILIHIRYYEKQWREDHCSIRDYIESNSNSELQVKPPDGAIEALLLTGRALIIMDGLDEVLDAPDRRQIRENIETFCHHYPSTPVLITSRFVGYSEAALDARVFTVYHLAEFHEIQIEEYVTKWFSLLDISANALKTTVQAFMDESKTAPELRSNPLMLALMCNIYHGLSYIPRNRPELYEKCSELLFLRWDRSRGLKVPLPFEEHIIPTMRHIAHWMFSNSELRSGVKEQQLIEAASGFLLIERYEKRHEADAAAKEFIQFCTGRAWVFTDMGAGIFKFSHNTFLEYFTAQYLAATCRDPKALFDALQPRIANQEWDVVAQIAVQSKNDRFSGAGTEFLEYLLDSAKTSKDSERANCLSFAIRVLYFMVPRPATVRKIATACLEFVYDVGSRMKSAEPEEIASVVRPVMEQFALNACESRDVFSDQLAVTAKDLMSRQDHFAAGCIAEIVLDMSFVGYVGRRELKHGVDIEYWNKFNDGVLENDKDIFLQLAQCDKLLAMRLFDLSYLTLSLACKWHGFEFLIRKADFRTLSAMQSPFLRYLLRQLTSIHSDPTESDSHISRLLHQLMELGDVVLSAPVFSLSGSGFHIYTSETAPDPSSWIVVYSKRINEDKRLLFGMVILQMMILESSSSISVDATLLRVVDDQFADVLEFRKKSIPPDFNGMSFLLDKGFNEEEATYINKWIHGEVSLCGNEETAQE